MRVKFLAEETRAQRSQLSVPWIRFEPRQFNLESKCTNLCEGGICSVHDRERAGGGV